MAAPSKLHFVNIELTSTDKDATLIARAAQLCSQILHEGNKILGLQLVCACNKAHVNVRLVKRFVNVAASPYGYSVVRITWQERSSKAKRTSAAKRMEKRSFYIDIVNPHSAKYTNDVLDEIDERARNISAAGGVIMTSSIACGCAPNLIPGLSWLRVLLARGHRSFAGPGAYTIGLTGYTATSAEEEEIAAARGVGVAGTSDVVSTAGVKHQE